MNDKNAIKKEEGMGVVQIIKLFILPRAFTVTQAKAATFDNYLDQSNVFFDDVSYAQVTISDSTTTATVDDIDISVEMNASIPAASDSNFDPSLSINASKAVVTAPEVIMLFGSVLIGLVVFLVWPEAGVNSSWLESTPALQNESAEILEWWTAFDDPVLTRLVHEAYEQNLSLRAAGLRVIQARAAPASPSVTTFHSNREFRRATARTRILKTTPTVSLSRAQDAAFQEAAVNYQNAVLQAAAEVESSLYGFLKSREQLVHAREAGLDIDAIDFDNPSALIIEDFGTCGLTGSVNEKDEDNFSRIPGQKAIFSNIRNNYSLTTINSNKLCHFVPAS